MGENEFFWETLILNKAPFSSNVSSCLLLPDGIAYSVMFSLRKLVHDVQEGWYTSGITPPLLMHVSWTSLKLKTVLLGSRILSSEGSAMKWFRPPLSS